MTVAVAATITAQRGNPTVTISPFDVSGYGNTGSSADITTGLVAATPQGGTAPYTYAWTQLYSTPYTWVITSPTAAVTSFKCNALGPGVTAEAQFLVTVTDSAGRTATAIVNAFANNGQPYDTRTATGSRSRTDTATF